MVCVQASDLHSVSSISTTLQQGLVFLDILLWGYALTNWLYRSLNYFLRWPSQVIGGLIRVDSIIRKLESVIRFFWLGVIDPHKITSGLLHILIPKYSSSEPQCGQYYFLNVFPVLLKLVWVGFLSVITRVLTDCNFLQQLLEDLDVGTLPQEVMWICVLLYTGFCTQLDLLSIYCQKTNAPLELRS